MIFICPNCSHRLAAYEYVFGSPYHYDGVSEYRCTNENCSYRIGRWCKEPLESQEIEPRFCNGDVHPKAYEKN